MPMWSVLLLPPGLLLVSGWAAALSAACQAHAAGRPVTVATIGRPVQEATRLLVIRRRRTRHPDALLWRVGGATLLMTAVLAAAVVPLGDVPIIGSEVGVVWFNAAETLLWAALWLTGWGANSVSGLVGGYRFLAQALAYELPLMLALITAAIGAASLDVVQIAAAQDRLWFVVWMPVAFAVFLISALALSFWGPFSQPSGADANGGVMAELSGVDRLIVLAGRYAWLTAAAGMSVPLFLGGGSGPLLPSWAWWSVKTLAVLGLLVLVRWRWPLVRVDRFEEVAWVVLLPAILVQALVVSVIVVF
ncbi:MAG: NADH-quinone oxidoreductase subunit H [Geodermatophilaceae bacterium]